MFKKNKTMGHIPYEENREIFELRQAYIQSLHPIGVNMVREFETYYIGNNASGYSLSAILTQIIDDYELWCKSTRTYDLNYWFNLNKLASIYNLEIVYDYWDMPKDNYPSAYRNGKKFQSYKVRPVGSNDLFVDLTPEYINNLLNADSKYKGLLRDDKKLAPITLVIGFSATAAIVSGGNLFNYKGSTTSAPASSTTRLGNKESPYSPMNQFANPQDSPFVTCEYLRDFIVNFPQYTPANLNNKYTIPNNAQMPMYMNDFTPNSFIAMMRDVISVIKWLELENNAMNIGGNTDGLKIDEYEAIISDQLSYLNNITDRVQLSLIDEKLAGQALKDSVNKAILEKKELLKQTIANKRNAIKLMNEAISKIKK